MARENHPEMSLRFNQVPLNCECVPSNHQIPAVLLLIYPGEVYSRVVNRREGTSASFSFVGIYSKEVDHSMCAEKKQCGISSLSAFCTLIGLDVRRALEMALLISLVNGSAPGTAKENDKHLLTKRWRLFTEITEHSRVC